MHDFKITVNFNFKEVKMKNHIFPASLLIGGSILVASSVVVNGNPVVYVGLLLIVVGLAERYIPVLKKIFKDEK